MGNRGDLRPGSRCLKRRLGFRRPRCHDPFSTGICWDATRKRYRVMDATAQGGASSAVLGFASTLEAAVLFRDCHVIDYLGPRAALRLAHPTGEKEPLLLLGRGVYSHPGLHQLLDGPNRSLSSAPPPGANGKRPLAEPVPEQHRPQKPLPLGPSPKRAKLELAPHTTSPGPEPSPTASAPGAGAEPFAAAAPVSPPLDPPKLLPGPRVSLSAVGHRADPLPEGSLRLQDIGIDCRSVRLLGAYAGPAGALPDGVFFDSSRGLWSCLDHDCRLLGERPVQWARCWFAIRLGSGCVFDLACVH